MGWGKFRHTIQAGACLEYVFFLGEYMYFFLISHILFAQTF